MIVQRRTKVGHHYANRWNGRSISATSLHLIANVDATIAISLRK